MLVQLTNLRNCLICEHEFEPSKAEFKKANVCKWCFVKTTMRDLHSNLTNDEGVAIVDAMSLIHSRFNEVEKTAWNDTYAREGMLKLKAAYLYLKFLLDGEGL